MDPAPAGTYLFHISDGTDISEERRLVRAAVRRSRTPRILTAPVVRPAQDLVGPVGRIYHSSELKSIAVEVGNKGAPGGERSCTVVTLLNPPQPCRFSASPRSAVPRSGPPG